MITANAVGMLNKLEKSRQKIDSEVHQLNDFYSNQMKIYEEPYEFESLSNTSSRDGSLPAPSDHASYIYAKPEPSHTTINGIRHKSSVSIVEYKFTHNMPPGN